MKNAHDWIKIDKEKMLEMAKAIAVQSRADHVGCAESTFIAIAETLGLKHKDAVAAALVGMSGGVADYGTGSCGAIVGAVAAISLVYNYIPTRHDEDQMRRYELFSVIDRVVERFKKKYGDLSCRAALMEMFGKSFDFKNKERLEEYKAMDKSRIEIISDAAMWAVEAIIDMKRGESSRANV